MEKLIDFDALFAEYLSEWYAGNKDKYADFGDLEEAAAGIYGQWVKLPLKQAGGVPPAEYFGRIGGPKELVALTVRYVMSDLSPPILLCDRIAAVEGCVPLLAQIIKLNENTELTVMAANILTEMQSEAAFPAYIDWIFDKNKNAELIALAVEKLTAGAETAGPMLLERLETAPADIESLKNIADILVHYNKDGRIFDILAKLLNEGGDLPLYAAYLGKYGDKRALPLLMEYGGKQSVNYLEYIELRNAVEVLGGELKNEKDFRNDKYYKALKDD